MSNASAIGTGHSIISGKKLHTLDIFYSHSTRKYREMRYWDNLTTGGHYSEFNNCALIRTFGGHINKLVHGAGVKKLELA